MTDYIRLLLEEQEDGESGPREEESWRPKEEGLALPLSDVGEKEASHPAWREGYERSENQKRPGETAEDTRRTGEAVFAVADGDSPVEKGDFTEENPLWHRETGFRTEEREARGEVPDALRQLWTARWLEVGTEEVSVGAEPDGLDEIVRSASGGSEADGTGEDWLGTDWPEADGRAAEWRELEARPVSLKAVEPGGGQTGGTAAEWTYQALRASLAQLPAPPRETRVVTLQKPAGGADSGGLDPEGLDRLLRRDARRFDGGFQLL